MATNYDKILSRTLSCLLRHRALKEGLPIKADGFIALNELLTKKLVNYSAEDILKVVKFDPKNRCTLREESGIIEIRANQGHTIKEITQLSLTPVLNPDFDIIHGTFLAKWKAIRVKGLSRMKRNHVHFAKGWNFICGLQECAEIFIFVNFNKASQQGISFYESENGVILSPGNSEGYLKPEYFLQVIDKQRQKIKI